MYARYVLLLCGLALLAAGCSSTRQIQTAAPLSALPTPSDTVATTDLARFSLMVEAGETSLPDDIQAMEFRVTEIGLKPTDGDWITFPADINSFDIPPPKKNQTHRAVGDIILHGVGFLWEISIGSIARERIWHH